MPINHKIFLEYYPQTALELTIHQNVVCEYFISDYWNQVSKQNTDNFYRFIIDLFNLASVQAPNTIKGFIKNPDVPLGYDKTQSTHCLYILAKGCFNGMYYEVKATSEHKYHKLYYVLERV